MGSIFMFLFYLQLCVPQMSVYGKDDYESLVDFTLADAKKDEITFRLATNLQPDLREITEETLKPDDIDTNVTTIVAIHGWLSIGLPPWYLKLKEKYLKKYNCNVILFDWSVPAKRKYSIASASTRTVGKFVADFLLKANLNLDKVHLIGYSLGTHLSGFVAKSLFSRTGKRVSRITALDPAAPKFENATEANRLDKSDAEFLDVIHTDIKHYGITNPIGHVDFYPNGGQYQPKCPSLEEDDNCSHYRAPILFVLSINTTIIAHAASSWEDFQTGKIQESVCFGENVPHTARGTFYFKDDRDYL